MTSRRHHEVSPGGDDQTHREHYGREERRNNRQERRESRRDGREEFRNERDSIRDEVDFRNARLPRRLNIRLAEARELISQHKKEGLEYEEVLRGFDGIASRVDALGDDTDEGSFEEGGKSPQRDVMRADLQKLREIIRGLRTSLRRHVNHVEAEAKEDDVVPVPPVLPIPPRHRGGGPRSNAGGNGGSGETPDNEAPDSTEPDPDGSEPLPEPKPGEESKEEQDAREEEERRERAEEEEARREEIDKERERAEEDEKDEEDEAEDEDKEEEPVDEELMKKLEDGLNTLDDPKYDDEFTGWITENKEPSEIIQISDLLLDPESFDTGKDAVEDLWEEYLDELVEDVGVALVKNHDVKPEDLNEDVDAFWGYYREADEPACVKDLREIIGGDGDEKAQAAFEHATSVYESSDFQQHIEHSEKQEDPLHWIVDTLENMNEADSAGMVQTDVLESGIELGLVNSKVELTFDEGVWRIDSKYPEMFKDGAKLEYTSPEDALVDARKILSELVFMEEVMTALEGRTIEESHKYSPFYTDGDQIMVHTNQDLFGGYADLGDADFNWEDRYKVDRGAANGDHKADHLVDIDTMVRTLNKRYLSETPPVEEDVSPWDQKNAEEHAEQVLDVLDSFGPWDRHDDLKVSPQANFTQFKVEDSSVDGHSITIKRQGDMWIMDSPHADLLAPGVVLEYSDPTTGLLNAISDAETILKRTGLADAFLKEVHDVEDPSELFKMAGGRVVMFNGRLVEDYDFKNTDLNHDLISSRSFIDSLNRRYLEESGQLTIGTELSEEQELSTKIWVLERMAGRQDLSKKPTFNLDGNELEVQMGGETAMTIAKEGDKWTLDLNVKYHPILKNGELLSFDSFEEVSWNYEQLLQTVEMTQNALAKVEDLELDPKMLKDKHTPFHWDGEKIKFADAENSEVFDFDTVLEFNEMSTRTHFFNISAYIADLNEIYEKGHQSEVADATQNAPDETAEEMKTTELVKHIKSFTDEEWAEVKDKALKSLDPSVMYYSRDSREEYAKIVMEKSTSTETWTEGLYPIIMEVKPLPSKKAPEKEATPEEDAPEEDAPEEDAPEEDAPEEDAPEEDAPEEDAPEEVDDGGWGLLAEKGETTEGTLEYTRDGDAVIVNIDEGTISVGEKSAKLILPVEKAEVISAEALEDGGMTITAGIPELGSKPKSMNTEQFNAVLDQVKSDDSGTKIDLGDDVYLEIL
jgi:hypothetical protein